MRFLSCLLILCFLPGLALGGPITAPASDLGQFPAIPATNLDKAQMNLPQDFAGSLNLVIISFAREQQRDVDTWIPVARQLEAAHSKLRYYELPTLSWENLLYRWWFNAALRSDTTDIALRKRILTAYVSKRKFRQALHIVNEKQVVAILVDRTGHVVWRADGPYAEADMPTLLSAIAASGA